MRLLGLTLISLMLSGITLSALPAFAQKTKSTNKKNIASNSNATLPLGDSQRGQSKAENERCMECHGVDGQGHGHVDGAGKIVKFAKLAGQDFHYLFKQIRDFREGKRKDDFMQMMAKSVDDQDMADILAYFSAQKPMEADRSDAVTVSKHAQALYLQGDPQRQILACASCHGEDARGIAETVPGAKTKTSLGPRLAGQEWRYLQKQLLDWRSGQRKNQSDGVMNLVTRQLSDQEIDQLASYLAAQP